MSKFYIQCKEVAGGQCLIKNAEFDSEEEAKAFIKENDFGKYHINFEVITEEEKLKHYN